MKTRQRKPIPYGFKALLKRESAASWKRHDAEKNKVRASWHNGFGAALDWVRDRLKYL